MRHLLQRTGPVCRRTILIAFALLLTAFAGCATTLTLRDRWNGEVETDWQEDPPVSRKVPIIYGGTRRDLRLVPAWQLILDPEKDSSTSRPAPSNEWAAVGACVGTVDLLPSFVLDTLTLPLTLVWSLLGELSDSP